MSLSEFKNKMSNSSSSLENYQLYPTFTFTQTRSHSPLENTYESFNDYSSDNQSSQFLAPSIKYENENVSSSMPMYNQYDSGYIHNSSLVNSPYYSSMKNSIQHRALKNVTTSIRFQSTPNKSFFNIQQNNPKITISEKQKKNTVNFHSILDLATSAISDDSKLCDDSRLSTNISQNFNNHLNSSNDVLNFNEKLNSLMAELTTNKENSNELITRTKRKPRTQINKQQKDILEYAYKMKSYPDSNEIEYLCNLLRFEENVIRVSYFF